MMDYNRYADLCEKLRAFAIISKRDEFCDAADVIEKLMEALKPFSDAWDEKETWRWQINIDDLRAARAAYLGENKL
jgi:hypothetical protein